MPKNRVQRRLPKYSEFTGRKRRQSLSEMPNVGEELQNSKTRIISLFLFTFKKSTYST